MNDRYEIIQLITKDLVGGVYLAKDTTLERKVAFRNFERVAGEEMLTAPSDEFAKFSGKLTALQHPNLLTIYDIAFDDGEAYMVTQYMDDESLAERLEKGALPQDRVYRMAGDVLEALHAAHESGVFHGALNTGSVHRVPKASGGHRYMVVDMGLNHLAEIIRGATGGIVDPILMAPELHDGKETDARVDLFMLGQLCYTALAGGHPFAENTAEECAELYRTGQLPPIEEFASGVQEDFTEWVKRLSNGDPEQRPADVHEAMELLFAITLPEPEPPAPVARPASGPVAPVATGPITAAAAVAATQSMDAPVPAAAKAKVAGAKKLPIMIAAVMIALIGGGVWYMMQRGAADQEGPAGGLPAVPEGVLVHMHSATAVGEEPVDLEVKGILDWSVTTGTPVSSSRERRDGGKYITSVFQSGKFQEFAGNKSTSFKFNAGDKELESKGISNRAKKLKAGQGWEVLLRIPQTHKGPLLVTCYVLHEGCGFTVAVSDSKEKKLGDFSIESNDAGKSRVLLEIPEPVPGGFYTFKVLVSGLVRDEPMAFGLGAIQVAER